MFNKFKEKEININNNSNQRFNRWKNKNKIVKFLLFSLIIFSLIGWFIYKWYINFKTKELVENEIIIEVNEWEYPISIASKLNLNENYLKIYLKNEAPDFELIIWRFMIEPNSDIENIIKSLKKPIIEWEVEITILEWWNIYDVDEYLTSENLIIENEYINYVNNSEKIEKLSEYFSFIKWLETLEWFLYPDTYRVKSENFKINEFVIKQLDNFEIKVYNTILSELDNETIKDVINLASIVEKEEKNIDEKATVAWILKKRLNNGWMIWADITVCYPHELTAQECKMVISEYINETSEYNTRTMLWLPKTPIWNPSFETINATLNSKNTEYWFYLHNVSTWQIYYWRNNTEHEQNKRLYMK